MPPTPNLHIGKDKLHQAWRYFWELHQIQTLAFTISYKINPCGYKTLFSMDLTNSNYHKQVEGADEPDAHIPYIHFFSFNLFVEILKNQTTTLF